MANNDDVIVPKNDPLPIVEGSPVRQRAGAHWLHLVLYLITSLIFAFFLVLGGRWVYHKTHHKSQIATTSTANTSPAPTANNVPAAPQAPAPPKSSPSAKTPATSGNKSTQPTQSSPPYQQSPNPSPSQTSPAQVPNTGPGNIAGIFIVVSVAAAALHYLVSTRKIQKS